jgi:hypothetical protein
MKALGRGSLSSVLWVVLTYCWLGAWFVTIAWVVLPIAMTLSGHDDWGFFFPANVNNAVTQEEAGSGGTWKLEVRELLVTAPPDRAWIFSLVTAPLALLIALVLGWLRAILASLRAGSPFIAENARRLQRIGVAVLTLETLRWVVVLTVVAPTIEGLAFGAKDQRRVVEISAWPDLLTLFLGGAVLVLAEVFRQGTRMQDEQSLTV